MCSGDIGNLFPRISFRDSSFICQIFFPHSSSPIACTMYSDVGMRFQNIRKWCRGIENCLTYIHREDRTGLPSIPGIYIYIYESKKGWRSWFRNVGESQFEIRLPHWSCPPDLYKTLSTKNGNAAKCVHAECTDICRKTKGSSFRDSLSKLQRLQK